MSLKKMSRREFDALKKRAKRVHIPYGNSVKDRVEMGLPKPAIAETLELKDGTLVSRFNLDVYKKRALYKSVYKPAGIDSKYPCGRW